MSDSMGAGAASAARLPGIVSVPRHIDGAVRVVVSDPKTNERVLRALKEAVA